LIEKHNLQNVPLGQYLHKCKICGKAYEKSTSLGGHISKAHVKFNQLN
jgi:predicted restriction endonuclease